MLRLRESLDVTELRNSTFVSVQSEISAN